jgi:hypothetical protein
MASNPALESTLYMAFTTRAAGIPTALLGTPVVSAYENADLTQITAGITLGVDHDSVTGLNMLTIVATAANGYEAGKTYHLAITTGTVDGNNVAGEIVGEFTILTAAEALTKTRLELSAAQIIPGTVDDTAHTPTVTVFQADDITEATTNHYSDRLIIFTTGDLFGQVCTISAYSLVGGRGQFTVTSLTEAPTNNDTFIMV